MSRSESNSRIIDTVYTIKAPQKNNPRLAPIIRQQSELILCVLMGKIAKWRMYLSGTSTGMQSLLSLECALSNLIERADSRLAPSIKLMPSLYIAQHLRHAFMYYRKPQDPCCCGQ